MEVSAPAVEQMREEEEEEEKGEGVEEDRRKGSSSTRRLCAQTSACTTIAYAHRHPEFGSQSPCFGSQAKVPGWLGRGYLLA